MDYQTNVKKTQTAINVSSVGMLVGGVVGAVGFLGDYNLLEGLGIIFFSASAGTSLYFRGVARELQKTQQEEYKSDLERKIE